MEDKCKYVEDKCKYVEDKCKCIEEELILVKEKNLCFGKKILELENEINTSKIVKTPKTLKTKVKKNII